MKTILLIDDDAGILQTFSLALTHHGYSVLTATSGDQGVKLARSHLPDLILCDVDLPGIDGCGVLRVVRADPELAARQVVLVTGKPGLVTAREGMDRGADDYLAKPVEISALLRCVEARLSRANIHHRVEDRVLGNLRATLQATLPNELFTPLAELLGLVEVLRGDIEQLRPSEMHELLDHMERAGLRLNRTVRNYLMLLDLEAPMENGRDAASTDGPETVRTIESIATTVADRHLRGADLRLATECVPAGCTVGDLSAVVEELTDNACKFSRRGTPVSVTWGAPGVLVVGDEGKGMDPAHVARIGTFRRLDRKAHVQSGAGFGLPIVQRLVSRNRGSFLLASEAGQRTSVTITFPVAEARAA